MILLTKSLAQIGRSWILELEAEDICVLTFYEPATWWNLDMSRCGLVHVGIEKRSTCNALDRLVGWLKDERIRAVWFDNCWVVYHNNGYVFT